MNDITQKILVLSGKGGVGKSTVAVNLAVWLSTNDKKVGLLDIDIHGPSVPKLLGLEDKGVQGNDERIEPVSYGDNLKVMSIGFLLPGDSDPVIWRGPMKHSLIKQFTSNVNWGRLDYLIVDCPPGTGDEPLSIVQSLENIDGAVVVTTPQQVSVIDVKKCISFCRQLNLPVLGVVENMSGFVCPNCKTKVEIFKSQGGQQVAEQFNVPFLGSIPIDCAVVSACDSGNPIVQLDEKSSAAESFGAAFKPLLKESIKNSTGKGGTDIMKIAIPVTNGKLSMHFGHCEQFAIFDVDMENKKITAQDLQTPPPHEPGVLPQWLSEMQVELIISGGMGSRAHQLFQQNNIEVIVGATDKPPQEIIEQYMSNELQTGQNICDH